MRVRRHATSQMHVPSATSRASYGDSYRRHFGLQASRQSLPMNAARRRPAAARVPAVYPDGVGLGRAATEWEGLPVPFRLPRNTTAFVLVEGTMLIL
jgi:hypothetical protein